MLGRLKFEPVQSAGNSRAEQIVQSDGLYVAGFDRYRRISDWVFENIPILNQDPSVRCGDGVFLAHGFQHPKGGRVSGGDDLIECLRLGVEIILGQGLEIVSGERTDSRAPPD